MYFTSNTATEFGIALIPSFLFGIITHEAGHAMGGQIAGIPILAWGVGVKEPWFRLRIGGTTFYMGWPLNGGITVPAMYTIERKPLREIILLIGGPAANIIGILIGVGLTMFAVPAGLVISWIFASTFLFLVSIIPWSPTIAGNSFQSDGLRILNIIRYWKQPLPQTLGPLLTSCRTVRDLLQQLGHESGAKHYTVVLTYIEACLGNTANSMGKLSIARSNNLPFDEVFASFCKSTVAALDGAHDADEIFVKAKRLCRDDSTAMFIIEVNEIRLLANRSEPIDDIVDQLKKRAKASRNESWLCAVEIQEFFLRDDICPADEVANELLKRHARFLSELEKATILAIATKRLFERHMEEKAQQFFERTKNHVTSTQHTINDQATRHAFVHSVTKILSDVPSSTDDWFKWNDSTEVTATDKSQRHINAKPLRNSPLVIIAIIFGVFATASASFLVWQYYFDFTHITTSKVTRLYSLISTYSYACVALSLVGVYRRQSFRGALVALISAGLSFTLAAYFRYYAEI